MPCGLTISGKNVLTKGRIAGADISGETMYIVWNITAGCHSPAVAVIGVFAAYSAVTLTLGAFQLAGQPPKLPLTMAGSRPHLTNGSLDPPDSSTKQHLDRFSRFCTAHESDQQTVRHTDTQTTLPCLQQHCTE